MLPILDRLHSAGLVHCDIKLENLHYKSGIYLLDWGLASQCHDSGYLPNVRGGSFEYIPLRVLSDSNHYEVSPSQDW
jgi:serine/threonine protein kinase